MSDSLRDAKALLADMDMAADAVKAAEDARDLVAANKAYDQSDRAADRWLIASVQIVRDLVAEVERLQRRVAALEDAMNPSDIMAAMRELGG